MKGVFAGFQKNLETNALFPPILDHRKNIPTGHLRPLGWQNRANAQISEESVNIKPELFWDLYVKKKTPVIIRGLVSGSVLIETWTDAYLKRNYGSMNIFVDDKMKKNNKTKIEMSLNKFLQGYRVEDWNLDSMIPDEIFSDVTIPHIINCGPYVHEATKYEINEKKGSAKISQLIEPYLSMSAGEISSLIQSRPFHNIHCVFDGREDFIIIPQEQFEKSRGLKNWDSLLDLEETEAHSSYWYSKINVDMVNAYKYKILQNLVWNWASLRAGDCIYLPGNYLHQIRSYGRKIATSIYFTTLHVKESHNLERLKQDAFTKCSLNAPLFESMKMFSKYYLWTHKNGQRQLNELETLNEDNMRLILLCLIRDKQTLYFETFDNFYKEITIKIKRKSPNLKTKDGHIINLQSKDVWQDFFKNTSKTFENDKEENVLTVKRIFELEDVHNFEKLKEILYLVNNYREHEGINKMSKTEL
jgi:hypothetical protein